MKIKDFIKKDIVIDVTECVFGLLDETFIGPAELTAEEKKRYAEILECEVVIHKGKELQWLNAYEPFAEVYADEDRRKTKKIVELFEELNEKHFNSFDEEDDI